MNHYGEIWDAAGKINASLQDKVAESARLEAGHHLSRLENMRLSPHAYGLDCGWEPSPRLKRKLQKVGGCKKYTYQERNALRSASKVTKISTAADTMPTVSNTTGKNMVADSIEQVIRQFGGEIKDNRLWLYTNDIVLEGYAHIGVLKISIGIPNLDVIKVSRTNNSGDQCGHIHPHVYSEGQVCYGDLVSNFKSLSSSGYVYQLVESLMSLLNTYNSRSPLAELSEWSEESEDNNPCTSCGDSTWDNYHMCQGCDDYFCSDCFGECESCGEAEDGPCCRHNCSICGSETCGSCGTTGKGPTFYCESCCYKCDYCGTLIPKTESENAMMACQKCQHSYCDKCMRLAKNTEEECPFCRVTEAAAHHATT